MRQLFLEKGLIAIKEVCEPLLEDNTVLVAVHYSFISSGTESATIANATTSSLFTNIPQKISKVIESITKNGIEGTRALIKGKLSGTLTALGYSCSGQVIAVGKNVKKLRAGDYVACAGAGIAHHADIIAVPENLAVIIHNQEYLQDASITTIGAIALQGIRRAQVQLGEYVCVLGLGLLGQITVQLALRAGCKVIGIDIQEKRLEQARKLGAHAVYNATDPNFIQHIAFLTGHNGVDCTIVSAASKSNTLMQQAMEITRKKGKVVIVGDVGLALERSPLYQKEIDVLMSCSYGPGRYDTLYEQRGVDYPFAYVRWTENRNMQAFVELIEHKQIAIGALVSACLPIEQAADGYELLQKQNGLGVILTYTQSHALIASQSSEDTSQKMNHQIQYIPATKTPLRLGVIGAGGFAKIKLIPILAHMNHIKINAIVDTDIANATNTARTYGAATALTADTDLFDYDLVDALLIASPHAYHCRQALRALKQGKAVFMEKPMVTDFEQLNELSSFLTENPHIPFCVDYNRSYAPFIRKIKTALEGRTNPLMIHYRMNAGFIPKDHWVQTEVGAGRIIGEACHIFDLFCYLTDSTPRAVSVESLQPAHDDIGSTDNVSVQISFADGSVCSLLYTALGNTTSGKERMELFFDSKTIVMDDYTSLHGYGLPASFNKKTYTADKGHEYLLRTFFNNMKEQPFKQPISIKRLTTVAQLTLIIDQLATAGGGNQALSL